MDPVSAIGLADNCLSFANALYSYITVVASAKDDIQSVSGELQATSVVLRDLGQLIEKYQHTDAWKGERMAYAQACLDKAERNIAKMKEMLLKTAAGSLSPNIERDDIDINKLQLLVFWPGRRSKLEERKAELAGSKTDILLAYTMYMAAAVPNSEAGKKAAAEIPSLFRASRIAKREIRRSKKRNKLRQNTNRQSSQDVPSDDLDGLDSHDYNVGDDALVYENEDDLRQDFEDWVREKEEKKREAEAKQKKLEEDAVEAWKKAQREQAEQELRQLQEQRSKLQNELEKQRLAPQQIRDALDHLHPLPRHDNNFGPTLTNGEDETLTTDPTDTNGRELQPDQSGRSIWSKFGGIFGRSQENHNIRHEIPTILQDPTRPGGFAEIAILLFEGLYNAYGQNVVQQVECDFESQWLIRTLREMETRHQKFDFDPALREFSKLPSQYKWAISAATQSYNSNRDSGFRWVLIFVRCLKLGRSQSWFKKSESRVKGVYIALKRTTISTANDNQKDEEPVAVESDRMREFVETRREYGRSRVPHSDSSVAESEEVFEPRRASRSRSRQAPRPESRLYPRAETSVAKRASKLSQVRAEDDYGSEDERTMVQRNDYAYPGSIIIDNNRARPRSRERTRPRRETYDTEYTDPLQRSIVRRRTTGDDRQPLPVVLAQAQQPYSAPPMPLVYVPPEQRFQAQWNPLPNPGYYEHRRRGNTYDLADTSQLQTDAMSRSHDIADSFTPMRQTSSDSYRMPKHIRFADTPQEVVVRRNRTRSRQSYHRAQTPIGLAHIEEVMKQNGYESSSSEDDDVNGVVSGFQQIGPEMSDERITKQLLSRFQTPDMNDHVRSESAPASYFGGVISEEPGSHSPAAGSQIGDNTILQEGTARFGKQRSRTVETVD